MNNSKILDQFYTNNEIAKKYYNLYMEYINTNNIIFDYVLEPSAGTGAFYNEINYPKIGIDIDPKIENILKQNFLDYVPDNNKKYIALGNPPFGKNSSLAVKFFNKCADFCTVIGFIIPKTFKKSSIKNRLNEYFHLVYEEDVPSNSFIYENTTKDVPTVFQIWKKEDIKRDKIKIENIPELKFVTKENGMFAFQRVGVNAGKIKDISENISDSSHYYINCSDKVKNILETVDWDTIKYNTAGNPSISKSEIIETIKNKL